MGDEIAALRARVEALEARCTQFEGFFGEVVRDAEDLREGGKRLERNNNRRFVLNELLIQEIAENGIEPDELKRLADFATIYALHASQDENAPEINRQEAAYMATIFARAEKAARRRDASEKRRRSPWWKR